MQDIAVVTGGQVISEESGLTLEKASLDELGTVRKIIVGKDTTTLVGGNGKPEEINARIKQIRREIDDATSDYDKEKLQERLAKLSGGVAELKVGGATETAMKEKKDRVEDAMHATKAAVEEGIVPGGGVALLRAVAAVDAVKPDTHDLKVGVQIVRRALEEPTRQIVNNAGEEGAVIVRELAGKKGNIGYNAATGEVEDLVKAGVIDPAKVTKNALLNASSIAGLLLTTEALVAEQKEEAPAGGGGHDHGGGGMDF